MTNKITIKTGKLFEAFYLEENLSENAKLRILSEKEKFLGNPLISPIVNVGQEILISVIGLTAFEMDVDYLYDKKIITDVPYNRLKTIIQEYKDELESLNTQE